jgi:hypothetical protein
MEDFSSLPSLRAGDSRPSERVAQRSGQAAAFPGVDGEGAIGVSGHEAEMPGRVADDADLVETWAGGFGQDQRMIDGTGGTDCFLGFDANYGIHKQLVMDKGGKSDNISGTDRRE